MFLLKGILFQFFFLPILILELPIYTSTKILKIISSLNHSVSKLLMCGWMSSEVGWKLAERQVQGGEISGTKSNWRSVYPGGQHRVQSSLIFSLLIWLQSIPPASLQVIKNQEEMMIYQRNVLPSRGTWKAGERRWNLVEFKKYKILHLGRSNSRHQNMLPSWKADWQKRTCGSWCKTKLNWSQKGALAAKKINGILGCIW